MKRRFAVGCIAFDVPKLRRLPAPFLAVESRVASEAVNMQMRVRNPPDWTRREVNELPPSQISSHPITRLPTLSHPRCGVLFDLRHRLLNCLPERFQDVLIQRHRIQN